MNRREFVLDSLSTLFGGLVIAREGDAAEGVDALTAVVPAGGVVTVGVVPPLMFDSFTVRVDLYASGPKETETRVRFNKVVAPRAVFDCAVDRWGDVAAGGADVRVACGPSSGPLRQFTLERSILRTISCLVAASGRGEDGKTDSGVGMVVADGLECISLKPPKVAAGSAPLPITLREYCRTRVNPPPLGSGSRASRA